MAKLTMIEAINRAHAWEMAHDPTVVVIGEDIGVNGGVFRATAGLQEKFRQGSRAGHAARRRHDRRHVHRHGEPGPAADRRDPVHGVHLPRDGSDRESHGPHAPSHARAPHAANRHTNASRRRHSRAGASFGKPGSDARASPGPARGVSVFAGAGVRLAACARFASRIR